MVITEKKEEMNLMYQWLFLNLKEEVLISLKNKILMKRVFGKSMKEDDNLWKQTHNIVTMRRI